MPRMWHNASVKMTVEIPDPIYARLMTLAAKNGTTIKALILRGVQIVLKGSLQKRRRKVRLPIVRSNRPGSLELDNKRILDIISFP